MQMDCKWAVPKLQKTSRLHVTTGLQVITTSLEGLQTSLEVIGQDVKWRDGEARKNIKYVWNFTDSPRQAGNLQPTLTDHVNIGPDPPVEHLH